MSRREGLGPNHSLFSHQLSEIRKAISSLLRRTMPWEATILTSNNRQLRIVIIYNYSVQIENL